MTKRKQNTTQANKNPNITANAQLANTGYFKKYFADFLAQFDDESYEMHREKKEILFKNVSGEVLEIGPGTGVNFPFLKGKNINWTGVEPNPAMHSYLFKAAQQNGVSAKLLNCATELIALPDNEVDYVVSTEVLCSVKDLNKSLSEIKRVLKPNGKFLFMEHVVDKHNFLRRAVQKIVPYTPWRYYSDGCYPARNIGDNIRQAGFAEVHYTDYMQEGNGIIITINRPHIHGYARK